VTGTGRAPLSPEQTRELGLLAERVRDAGLVDLGIYDEAELLAAGCAPAPRRYPGAGTWPPYLGVAATPEELLDATRTHPAVRAAAGRMAETRPGDPGPAAARLLGNYTSGIVGCFSASWTEQEPAAVLVVLVQTCRWSPSEQGLCVLQSMPAREPVTADAPLPMTVYACTPQIAALRIVEATFRDPLTPAEKDQAPGTRTAVIVDHGALGQPGTSFDLRHTWGAPEVRYVPSGTPLRRRRFSAPGVKTSSDDLAEAFTRILTGLTGA
jgi:hypothetical protein